jgi:peptide-methionine (S)-S-oxide reductase
MTSSDNQTAIFAAGCFWGVESTFRKLDGVVDTEVGYTGGQRPNPSYEQVCSGATGHAEAVKVTYDPSKIDYEKLVEVFFEAHDPTTKNRQGPDVGSQYRSAIFYLDEDQHEKAEQVKERYENSNRFGRSIVTEISPASEFYRAEEYHQQYFEKKGVGSCRF